MDSWSSPGGAARILIVDDDDYVREVTAMTLAEAGHSVRATANGSEALRCLDEQPCDLLLVDVRRPEMDGPALYREVRWPTGGPHVLFLSGSTEMADRDKTGKTLDAPVLVKPFTLDDLRAAGERIPATA